MHTHAHTHARTHTHVHTHTHTRAHTHSSCIHSSVSLHIPVPCAHDCFSVLSQVGRLELVYRLKNKPDTVAVLSEKCHLVRDKELCVHRDHVNSFNEVNKELARYFSVGNMQCRNEIRRVSSSSSQAFPIIWGRRNGFEFQSSILSRPIHRPPLTPHFPYLFYASFFVRLVFCHPLRLFPGSGASTSLLSMYPSLDIHVRTTVAFSLRSIITSNHNHRSTALRVSSSQSGWTLHYTS